MKKKSSNGAKEFSVDMDLFYDFLKKIYLGGLIQEAIINIDENGMAEVAALDGSDTLVLSVRKRIAAGSNAVAVKLTVRDLALLVRVISFLAGADKCGVPAEEGEEKEKECKVRVLDLRLGDGKLVGAIGGRRAFSLILGDDEAAERMTMDISKIRKRFVGHIEKSSITTELPGKVVKELVRAIPLIGADTMRLNIQKKKLIGVVEDASMNRMYVELGALKSKEDMSDMRSKFFASSIVAILNVLDDGCKLCVEAKAPLIFVEGKSNCFWGLTPVIEEATE